MLQGALVIFILSECSAEAVQAEARSERAIVDECALFEAFLTFDPTDEDALEGRRLSDVKVAGLEFKLHNRQVLFNFDFTIIDIR